MSAIDSDPQRPYRDAELVHLYETLEAQYDRGEAFSEDIVWELVHRLGEAEAMLRRHGIKSGFGLRRDARAPA
jgi:hypothetical protein